MLSRKLADKTAALDQLRVDIKDLSVQCCAAGEKLVVPTAVSTVLVQFVLLPRIYGSTQYCREAIIMASTRRTST